MAVIEVQPIVLKDVVATIGEAGDDYRKALSSVTFTPTTAAVTWTGLGNNTFTDQSLATWVAALAYAQDWDTAGSLSQYLHENEGETVPMTFRPRSGTGPSFTTDVTITPGAIGGAANAVAVATVNLGCTKPELVPAV